MNLKQRMKQLEAIKPQIDALLMSAAENATIRAIEKAAELTPPVNGGSVGGTNTRTGEMKQHWATDSVTTPRRSGTEIITELNNNMEYAAYVNYGHRLDRHFVPGLYVNESSGLLEYDPSAKVGIVVGTKTTYVEGLHMVDAARKEYRKALKAEMKKIKELLK